MVIASRRRLLPRPQAPKVTLLGWLTVVAFLLLGVAALAREFLLSPVLGLFWCLVFVGFCFYTSWLRRTRLAELNASRPDESICTFVRTCDYRSVDLVTLRAVYEEVAEHLSAGAKVFPIRPDDNFEADLLIDSEDLEDMVVSIAARCGRSLESYRENPYYEKVKTPFGLTQFLTHQPRIV